MKKRISISKIIFTIIKLALIVYLSLILKRSVEPMIDNNNYKTKQAIITNVTTELVEDEFSGRTYNMKVLFDDSTKIETKNQGANTANAYTKSIGQPAELHFYKNLVEYSTITYEEIGIESKEYSIDSKLCNLIKLQDFTTIFILLLAIIILIGLL